MFCICGLFVFAAFLLCVCALAFVCVCCSLLLVRAFALFPPLAAPVMKTDLVDMSTMLYCTNNYYS